MISLVYTCIQEQRGRENPSLTGVIRKARRHAKRMSNPLLAGVMPYLWKARKAVTNANNSKPNVSKSKPNVSKSKRNVSKSKQEVIVKYNQIFAESITCRYEHIKHEQTCECNSSMNDQHTKNKTECIDQDNPMTTHALYTAEIKCVMSRGRRVSKCTLPCSRNREREPSRIPYRKVISLFRKTRIARNLAKSYLKKYIPYSSKLKLMLYEYNRHHFSEQFGRSKCVFSSKKFFVRQNLYRSVV